MPGRKEWGEKTVQPKNHDNSPTLEFLQRQINEMGDRVAKAQNLAAQAFHDISTHEKICAERYSNIKDSLTLIPKIFTKLEKIEKVTNRATGAFMLAKTGFVGVMIAIIVYIAKH